MRKVNEVTHRPGGKGVVVSGWRLPEVLGRSEGEELGVRGGHYEWY